MSELTLPSEDEIAAQIADFASAIEGQQDRWEYCLRRVCHRGVCSDGEVRQLFHHKVMHRVTRILGRDARACRYRLGMMLRGGYQYTTEAFPDMSVCALQPWMLGHVYFARVATHPHVMKVGFSRRVRSRILDIQNIVGSELLAPEIHVGTGADESWWHHELQGFRISGEWFFDHYSDDRTVPDFLASEQDARAA